MGAGQVDAPRAGRRERLGWRGARRRRAARGAVRRADRSSSSTARARRRSASASRTLVLELLDAPGPGDRGARRRRRRDRRACATRSPTTSCVHVDVDLETAVEARRRDSAGRWPATAQRFERLYAPRRPLYESVAGAGDGLRRRRRRRRPALAPGVPRRGGMLWSRARGHPVWPRRRAGCAVLVATTTALLRVADEHALAAARRAASRRALAGHARRAARRAPQEHRTRPSACCARWRGAGMQRTRHGLSRSGAASSGDLGGLLRGDLPAWSRGRAGSDDGRRAGRLRLRRQDRRRPSRGEELRRRVPSAGRGVHRPGPARNASGRGAARRASPRS